MKKFLSIILAVVMIASLLPATFVSAAEGDIVFDFLAYLDERPGMVRHTELTASPFEGLTLNTSGTGANAGMLWETSGGRGLRWNNTKTDWQRASYSAGNANSNNKVALDYTVPTAGWYRFSAPWTNANAGLTVAVYDIFNNVPSFMGEVQNGTLSDAVYLEAGTHTLLLCAVASGVTADCPFIKNFTFTKVDAPTGSVELAGFPTSALGIGSEVAGTAVVNTNYGAKQFSAFGVKLSATNVKYRVETAGDTSNYIKVTYSTPGVAEVTVTPNTDVGAKGSVPYTVKGVAEGTTDVTFTPVVGGVEQSSLATTKTISVLDTNIVYDFDAFVRAFNKPSGTTTFSLSEGTPAGFAANASAKSTPVWEWRNYSLRFSNVDTASGYGFDITVPAAKAGMLYTPEINFASSNCSYEIHLIAGGKQTYLGDVAAITGVQKLKPVQLAEGVNTLTFTPVVCAASGASYVSSIAFKKYDGTAPTVASFTADAPASLGLGKTSGSYTASVDMSDGSKFAFPYYGMYANFSRYSGNDQNTIKFEVSPADALRVTATKNTTDAPYTAVNYTVEGLKAGTATLTITPVIAGVAQTDKAVTKTINVVDENIVYDFVGWVSNNIEGGSSARHVILTAENSPAGFGIADGMTELIKWDAGYLRFESISDTWGSDDPVEDRAPGSRFAMTIDVSASQAGWYTPELKYHGNAGQTGLCSVYHIYNGKATYLGDTVNGGANQLAPVYLSAGENILVVAAIDDTDGMFVTKLAFYKYEGEQATLTGITVADPADLTVGETSGRYEITGAMSDGSAMKFPPLGMDTETFHNSGANTTDYIKVTATPANVVEVNAYSGGYEAMNKYYYEVKAVGDGDAVLSFVPVVNGVEMTDLKVTKTISATYPNGNITGENVEIAITAVANGAVDAGAKALISGDLTAGIINSVAVGTEITLTAESNDDYTFLYWYNGNSKKILSDAEQYNFTAGTNIPVYAKYLAKDEVLTEYADATGKIVDADDIEVMPAKPYKKAGYTLYVDDVELANAEEASATNENAVYWTKEGEIVSYNTTYTYLKWGNLAEPVAVTEGVKSNVPAVVLFESNGAYMLELVNFEGKTIIEKGIAFNGDIDSCESKAVSTTDAKQFTATGEGEARAYVIYRDGVAIRVAYSD